MKHRINIVYVLGAAVATGALMILVAAILAAVFPQLITIVLNREIMLQDGGRTYKWWKQPPVIPQMRVYIYNVTNADEFLNNGEKPALHELGPYTYFETWEKVNLKFNPNGTITYNVKKNFVFSEVSILALNVYAEL